MLLCPNGISTSSNQFSKADNRRQEFTVQKPTYCAAPDEATSEVDSSFLGTFTSRRFGTLQGSSWLEQRLCWKSAPYKEFYFQILHICTGNFFFDCLNNYFLDKESKVKLGDKKCLVNWKCGQFCTFFVLLTY